MKDLKHIRRFNESDENSNISDVRSSKKFEVEIKGNDGKVIFSDIIDAYDLNDAFDKSVQTIKILGKIYVFS